MQKIESAINGTVEKYLTFIDWVAKNPNKFLWASVFAFAVAVWL